MSAPVICLLTDFGAGSHYVAQMKGVIYGILPGATVVDATHSVRPQDVRHAAWLLDEVRDAFPQGTTFVVVVDPGVGSKRRIIGLRTKSATYIAPDNGVLSRVRAAEPESNCFQIENPRLWRDDVSATFHGRDIMSPVAAHLAGGHSIEDVGPPIPHIETLDFPAPRWTGNQLVGRIEYGDSFGNLITNVCAADLDELEASAWVIEVAGHDAIPLVNCYADKANGDCVALFGSAGRLEIAIVAGSAAKTLALGTHDKVICRAAG